MVRKFNPRYILKMASGANCTYGTSSRGKRGWTRLATGRLQEDVDTSR